MHVSVEDDFQSGFVVIMRRASVIAYMKFLDPIFRNLEGRLLYFCLAKILGVNNEGKGSWFVPIFLFLRANIPSRVFVNIENRDCAVCTKNRLWNSGIKGWVG